MDWINRLELIKNKLKGQLNARAVDTILQSQPVFAVSSFMLDVVGQEYDKDKSGTLDRLEFEAMLSKLGIFLKTQELTAVYNQFDKNRDGTISYLEFINVLKVSGPRR